MTRAENIKITREKVGVDYLRSFARELDECFHQAVAGIGLEQAKIERKERLFRIGLGGLDYEKFTPDKSDDELIALWLDCIDQCHGKS